MADTRHFKCYDCNHEWSIPYGTGQSGLEMKCPKCSSTNIHREDIAGPGHGRGPSPVGRGRGGPGRGPRFKE
jgi:phage FluMu protein Com